MNVKKLGVEDSQEACTVCHTQQQPYFHFWSFGNIVTALILLMGIGITIGRFGFGIGAVTNLDDNNPWGLWIGFDLLCGVALAAGGYTTTAAYYLFGIKKFHSAVRPAILTAFLGYAFVVVALLYDVGQPWRLALPLVYSQGTTSLLFEVGLCVGVYLTVLFIECAPIALEWIIGKRDTPRWINRWKSSLWSLHKGILFLVIPLTVLGVVLSTMHQSSLGALYLITPGKLHPLWYSPFIPVFFFISSMPAGLSMVIFEGMLAKKAYSQTMDKEHIEGSIDVELGFGKAAAFILIGYFSIKIMDVMMDHNWPYLFTWYGVWFLLEMVGFVLLPAFIYAIGVREHNLKAIRVASVMTILGIILNRFNVSIIGFNWQLPVGERYFPSFAEIGLSIFIVTLIVTAYRIIVSYMPVLYEHRDFRKSHH